jgi:protocatechuate 3,4-dioxygenase, alpha subunit
MATTPSQTVGPFFSIELPFGDGPHVVREGTDGAIWLRGRVLDGAGDPVPDAILELWQTDARGHVVQEAGSLKRDGYTFTGWGRASTDREGRYAFSTLVPGAPFFALTVFARGLLNRLFTRAYLPEAGDDPFLQALDADRRSTLVTTGDETGFVFDVHLQGDQETVFLSYPRH